MALQQTNRAGRDPVAEAQAAERRERIEHLSAVFKRIVSVFLLLFALRYWATLTGTYGDPQWRFDLAAPEVRAAFASLAVLLPVASLGLWSLNAWGVVIWIVAALGEIVMYGGYAGTFGFDPTRLMFHLLCLVVFAILVVTGRLAQRTGRPGGSPKR